MINQILTAAMGGLFLVACGSVTPAGIMAAARLDPLGTPPAALSVAVSVPHSVKLQDGDTTLRLAFTPDDPTTAAVSVTVPLSVRIDATGPAPTDPQDLVYVMKLAPENATAMATAQREIIALRAAAVEGEGSLAINVTGGCVISQMPDALPVATWLRPEPAGTWAPLTRRNDLFEALPPMQATVLRSRLKAC